MSKFEMPDWLTEHLRLYEESPEKGHLFDTTAFGGKPDTPTLLLTTIGRKSGKPITLPLTYGFDGNKYVVAGTKGGSPEHPSWYLNLLAHPDVDVQVAARKFRAKARTANGKEREHLWLLMIEVLPVISELAKLTSREIPVVVLESA